MEASTKLRYIKKILFIIVFVLFFSVFKVNCLPKEYILQSKHNDSACNKRIYTESSVVLRSHMNAGNDGDSSTYSPNENCSVEVIVRKGRPEL